MNAKLLVTVVTLVMAISVVIVLTVSGNDKNNDGILDAFTLTGALTCDGCVWKQDDGTSDTVMVELAVTTLGTVSMNLHAYYGVYHWYLVDSVWYTAIEPGTTLDGETEPMLGDSSFELESVTYTKDSAPLQLMCSSAAWDGELFSDDFSVTTAGDTATVETMFGAITISFADGAPTTMTADYIPQIQTVSVGGGYTQKAKVTLDVKSFSTEDTGITVPTYLSDTDCDSISDTSPERVRHTQRRRLLHLSPEERHAIFEQEIKEMDERNEAEYQKYKHLGEAASTAMNMGRTLAQANTGSEEEKILQAAIGVYNYNGDIPSATCYVQNTGGVDTGFNNGYSLVARGGYESDASARPSGWDDVHSPQHSMICSSGTKCIFAWRGSTVLENWINNVNFFKDDIPSKISGETREVHTGFYKEVKFGMNAKNSYGAGVATEGDSLETIWKSMGTLTGCTTRYYTGHSLGGACAAVGHWYFEVGADTKVPDANVGSGVAVTFAAPQPWRTRNGDGVSDDPQCNNKRLYLKTTFGDDPVPGLPGILLSDWNGLYFDHADSAFPFYQKWGCSSNVTWKKKTSCWWGGCVSWWYPSISASCGWSYKLEARGCDDEDGGGLNPLYHLSKYYIRYFHKSLQNNNPCSGGVCAADL